MSISERVSDSFAKQQFMATLGASLLLATTGAVEITIPFRADLTQQNEFLHAGVITSILDSACGYAALTVAPRECRCPKRRILKSNLLSPAVGEKFIARAQVKKSGKRITVCTADAFAVSATEEKLIATMLATIMTMNAHPMQELGPTAPGS